MQKYKNKIGYVLGAILLFISTGGFLEQALREIMPFIGILFLMIAYPVGLKYVWNALPSRWYRAGLILSAIGLELTLPMALPYDVGKNYREFVTDILDEIKGVFF
jgi:hypothetical protein